MAIKQGTPCHSEWSAAKRRILSVIHCKDSSATPQNDNSDPLQRFFGYASEWHTSILYKVKDFATDHTTSSDRIIKPSVKGGQLPSMDEAVLAAQNFRLCSRFAR